MATKTIRITEEAYEGLKSLKKGKESFSDVILRYYPKRRDIKELLKRISEGEYGELADAIEAGLEPHRMGKER